MEDSLLSTLRSLFKAMMIDQHLSIILAQATSTLYFFLMEEFNRHWKKTNVERLFLFVEQLQLF